MKRILLILIATCYSSICLSQTYPKQETLIPLNNLSGVPFYKDREINDMVINGFDVDEKGILYFMAGEKTACLAAFSNGKQLYRKTYTDLLPDQIHVVNQSIYVSNARGRNDLYVIDRSSGIFVKKVAHLTSKNVNTFHFMGGSLIAEYLSIKNSTYEQFDLSGKFLKQISNPYGLPSKTLKNIKGDYLLIGDWNSKYVFYNITGAKLDTQTFLLIDKNGDIKGKRDLPNNNEMFGNGYVGGVDGFMKISNGSMYILGRKRIMQRSTRYL